MDHAYYINECFKLALKGIGTVTPNPLVGSLIVMDQKIVGSGYHRKKGENHAEINAILDAKKKGITDFKKATLYCNLEPCCHTNKLTPPCVATLIKEQFASVVISNLDPNPQVSGNGVAELRAAGITVTTNVLEESGALLNEIFFTHMTKQRPFIHLKWAQSSDGFIGNGTKYYLSSKSSLALVHQLRKKYDAVMIGRETLNSDNPKLTIRVESEPVRSPKRIVVGSYSKMDKRAELFNDAFKAQTLVVTYEQFENSEGLLSLKERDLKLLLKELYSRGITSILVEGGAELLKSFIQAKLIDRVSVFITPNPMPQGVKLVRSPLTKAQIVVLTESSGLQVEQDMLFEGRVKG